MEKKPQIKVEFPKEGGILSHVEGEKYPRKGFPEMIMVELILPTLKGLIPMITNYGSKVMRKFEMSPKRYCRAVRELHRVLTVAASRATERHIKEKILGVRDLICPVLELDDFYRNIFQDMAEEIKIEELWPDEGDRYFRKPNLRRYKFKNNNKPIIWKSIK